MYCFAIIVALLSTSFALKKSDNVFSKNLIFIKKFSDEIKIEPRAFEDIINSTIEGLRPDIPDPVTFDNLTIDAPNDGLLK